MKKFVLDLDLQNDRDQQRRALKTIATLSGIDQISIDLKGKKVVVVGKVDPISVVNKLRKKNWSAEIFSVGIWPEKKEEPKKEEELKKEEPKNEEVEKKFDETKKDDEKKVTLPYKQYQHYYMPPPPLSTYYPVQRENPNECIVS